jgi:hypothetical protein
MAFMPQRAQLSHEFSNHVCRQARDPPVADDCCTRRVPHHTTMIDDQDPDASPLTVHELVRSLRPAPAASQRPVLHPAPTSHLRGLPSRSIVEDSVSFTRPVFPLPVAPGWNGSPWASSPSFAPRRYQQRTSERGRALDTGPGHVIDVTPTSSLRDHSQRATSRRTTYLTVLGTAGHAGVLPLHPGRHRALLDEPGVVDDQNPSWIPEPLGNVFVQVSMYIVRIPAGPAQQVLQARGSAVTGMFSQLPTVFAAHWP